MLEPEPPEERLHGAAKKPVHEPEQRDMHEPPAYAARALHFDDDSYAHLHPFTD